MPIQDTQPSAFARGDSRCSSSTSASSATVVQWIAVVAAGPLPLWIPLPISIGAQLEQMHAQEARYPSSDAHPRQFLLPVTSREDAYLLLFGTNVPYRDGLALSVSMRTGHYTIPLGPPSLHTPPAGLQRPLRRVLLTHTHA